MIEPILRRGQPRLTQASVLGLKVQEVTSLCPIVHQWIGASTPPVCTDQRTILSKSRDRLIVDIERAACVDSVILSSGRTDS